MLAANSRYPGGFFGVFSEPNHHKFRVVSARQGHSPPGKSASTTLSPQTVISSPSLRKASGPCRKRRLKPSHSVSAGSCAAMGRKYGHVARERIFRDPHSLPARQRRCWGASPQLIRHPFPSSLTLDRAAKKPCPRGGQAHGSTGIPANTAISANHSPPQRSLVQASQPAGSGESLQRGRSPRSPRD